MKTRITKQRCLRKAKGQNESCIKSVVERAFEEAKENDQDVSDDATLKAIISRTFDILIKGSGKVEHVLSKTRH